MKTKSVYFLLLLVWSCGTANKEKYININDYRNAENPDNSMISHLDKDIEVNRISFGDIEAYSISVFREENGQIKENTEFYLGSNMDYDMVSYQWANDSTLFFKLINTSNNQVESYSLVGGANRSSTITLLGSGKSEDYRPQSGDVAVSGTVWTTGGDINGSNPGCYNYRPEYDTSIDNKLQVIVGSNADVVIKVVDLESDVCIRYVYIRKGSTFDILNLPESRYYLKIAYGSDWRLIIMNGQCIGRFVTDPLYRKGEEILDFTKKYKGVIKDGANEYERYEIPSYVLFLDVIYSNADANAFPTDEISEEEFNR